ncbi:MULTISPECIES: DUF1617 family protein [Bhargavaea]|uniref:DUF1617 family protein n=1 Tax=Bhargavaea changchunensis TaxID=2134037 RepID=A0ABW2NBR5_9BACL|nr:DUF1617 family protein [Bhargavaea sp. CC-171006]
MKIAIENGKLGQAISLLFDLPLKGKQSRHRTKFIGKLNARLEEVENDRIALAKEHAKKDADGEAVQTDGNFDIVDVEAFSKDLKELYAEEMIIEGGDVSGMLKTVKAILEDCDKELSGQEAFIYDYLCDQFEKGVDEE